MRNRSVGLVILFSFITFGIYSLYWAVSTKNEMNRQGATIPTGWLLIIPIVNIWWQWKYCEGVDHVSDGKISAPVAFILVLMLGIIGVAVIQATFNKIPEQPQAATLPQARVA